jgi:hypothetical protein
VLLERMHYSCFGEQESGVALEFLALGEKSVFNDIFNLMCAEI